MKIEFENGSSIESLDTATDNIRGKRGEDYIEKIPYSDTRMDEWKANPAKFAEDCLGVKLLPYQKILLNLMNTKDKINYHISRTKQNKLTFTTQYRILMCLNQAILGQKVLILDGGKRKLNTDDIINIFNMNYSYDNEIKYKINDKVISFNTGGSIELSSNKSEV
jgi:hypothetical protein